MKMKKRIASIVLSTVIVASPITSIFNQDAGVVLAWQDTLPEGEEGGSGQGGGNGGGQEAKPFIFLADESTIKDGEVDVPEEALFMLKFSNNASDEEVFESNKEKIKVYEITDEGEKLADYTITEIPKGYEDEDEFLYRRYIAINFNEYKPSTVYKIAVEAGVEARNGTKLEEGFEISFTSAGEDEKPPVVTPIEKIVVDSNAKYLDGFEDGTIKPDADITRAEVAKILTDVIESAPDVEETPLIKDLKDGAWYESYAKFVISKGIMVGDENGNFRPNDKMTRAEVVTTIRDLISSDIEKENKFTDLTDKHWAYNHIMSAYNAGHVSGFSDGSFKPDAKISRAEVAQIINNVIGKEVDLEANKDKIKSYKDLEKNHWGYKAMITGTLD